MKKKVLFILKRREDYNGEIHSPKGLSTGLYNSASFVDDMLRDLGIESNLEVAIDNNCIDRLVTLHKPTHVIIEALWVVPTKFEVLTRLHPNVRWIIRLHSEMPFMAGEGMSMDWLADYVTYPQVDIAINAPRMLSEIKNYLRIKMSWTEEQADSRVFYLPNFYPQEYKTKKFDRDKKTINVSCFGAIRPLKNHLLQAHAALKFADRIGKKLRFHINMGRIEMQGSPVLHNLRDMFQQLWDQGHELVGHEWTPREQFLEICSVMDIGMQCNFSETFNIVSADLISQGVPIVGSVEIPWSTWLYNAQPAFSEDICRKLERAYRLPDLNVWLNQRNLTKYTNYTKLVWKEYFKETEDV
jgi:hypothetical protein